jgi:hypothetical protein
MSAIGTDRLSACPWTLPLLEVGQTYHSGADPSQFDPNLTCSEQDAIGKDDRANVQSVVADRHRGNRN